ncbi:MAG: PKD-like domain-containing protein, partial [Flavobacteriaceae bacterium]
MITVKSYGFSNGDDLLVIAPSINDINPTLYCYDSPQNITITGTNLASVTTVYIGTTLIPDVTVSSATIIINSIPEGTSSGLIRVVAPDDDDLSSTILNISDLPAAPGLITGDSQLCRGSTEYIFSVDPVDGANAYVWTFSPNISTNVDYGGNPTNERTLRFSVPNTVALGNYTLSVTAQNSCGNGNSSSPKSFNIGQLPDDAGVITEASNSLSICSDGQSTIQLTVPEINGADTYIWENYAGFTPVGATNGRTLLLRINANAIAGNRNISVKANNDCGDGVSSIYSISVNSLPGLDLGGNQTVCLGDAATIGEDLGGGFSYSWSASPDHAFNKTIAEPSVSPTESTSYTLTVTNNATGCSTSENIQVFVNPLPTVNTGGDQTICSGDTVTLGAASEAGYTYQWSYGGSVENSSSIDVSPLVDTDYTLTVTNNNTNCSDDQTIRISVDPLPTIFAGNDATVCSNDVINLNGSYSNVVSSSISWSGGNEGSFAPDFSSYSPSATDIDNGFVTLSMNGQGAGACDDIVTDNVVFTFQSLPTASINAVDSICEGDTITLVADTTFSDNVTWIFPGSSENRLSSDAYVYTPTANDITAGEVTVELRALPIAPCSDPSDTVSTTKTILITTAPEIVNVNYPASFCEGGGLNIPLSTTANNGSVLWIVESGSGSLGNANDPNNAFYTPAAQDYQDGSVTLKLSLTGNNTCGVVSQSFTIPMYQEVTVDPGPTRQFCENENLIIDDVVISDTNDVDTYQWSVQSGNATIQAGTQNQVNPTVVPSGTGDVSLQLVVTPNAPCANVITVLKTLSINKEPLADAGGDQSICVDLATVEVQLQGNSGDGYDYDGYQWSGGNGTFGTPSLKNTSYTPTNDEMLAGSVELTFTVSQDNCTSVSDNMVVNFFNDIEINAGADRVVCEGNSITINDAQLISPSAGVVANYPVTYQWTFIEGGAIGTLSNPTSLSPTFNADGGQGGTVRIRLTATPDGNYPCQNTVEDEIAITVNLPPTVAASSGAPIQDYCQPSSGVFTIDLNQINPTRTNPGLLEWTTSGSGTFSNNNTQFPNYFPSDDDVINGSVVLTITNNGLESCDPVSDSYTINLIAQPVVNIFSDADDSDVIVLCEDEINYSLSNVNVQNVGEYLWSGGTGFSATNIANPTYTFTAADISAGSVQLTLMGTNNTCGETADDVLTINFQRNPSVNTGLTTVVLCSSVDQYTIANATASNTANTVWTVSGGTGSFDTTTDLIATYSPSEADRLGTNNPIIITLQGNPIAPCDEEVTDSFALIFDPIPVINTPTDQSICETDTYQVNGITVDNAYDSSSIEFTSSGRGTFTNTANPLEPIYQLHDDDRTAGTITITLTIAANSSCNQNISASFPLQIEQTPKITLTDNEFDLCEGDVVSFNNLVSIGGNYSSITWTTPNGGGSFSDPNIEEPSYTPGANDVFLNPLQLVITVNPLSDCTSPVSETINVFYNESPEITTLTAPDVCEDSSFTMIRGINFVIDHYESFFFSDIDNSAIISNNGTDNVTIMPSNDNIVDGYVDMVLTLTPNPSANCAQVSQTLRVNIQPLASISVAESTATICENETYTIDDVVVNNEEDISWTAATVNNTGFSTLVQQTAIYTPLAEDINRGYVDLTISASHVSPTCEGEVAETIRLNITKAPVVVLSQTPSRTLCVSSTYVVDANDIVSLENHGSILWETPNGSGILTGETTLTPVYTPSVDDLNLPDRSVQLVLTASPLAGCGTAASDDFFIEIQPQATVSIDDPDNDGVVTVCENGSISLSATADNYDPTSISWTVIGAGSITAGGNTLNPTFTADNGNIVDVRVRVSVTSIDPCNDEFQDEIIIRTARINTVGLSTNAVTLCKTESIYNITGSAAIDINNIIWESSGSGTFADNTDLNTGYSPSQADKDAGAVTLTLRGLSSDPPCDPLNFPTATLRINFEDPPSANFVNNEVDLCVGADYTINDLTASYNNISWQKIGGSGVLLNATTNQPTYQSDNADNGQVLLVGTLTGDLVCDSITITKTINIIQKLEGIDLGADQTYCSNDSEASLTATFTPGSFYENLTWNTSGDGTFDTSNSSTTLVRYSFGASDLQANNNPIEITLTGTQPNACSSTASQVVGTMYITIEEPPVITSINVGKDPICENGTIDLTAVLGGATPNNVYWTATQANLEVNSGFTDGTTLNPSYSPTALDISLGSVSITLHAVSEAPCDEITQTINVGITSLPTVDAGDDLSACQGGSLTIADATATGGSLQWTVAGFNGSALATGTLLSNDTTIQPSLNVASNQTGQLVLTLTNTPQDGCFGENAVVDTKIIDIQAIPIITGKTTDTHCQEQINDNYQVDGIVVQNTNTYSWQIIGGGGTLSQNNVLDPIYSPVLNDYQNGSVTLRLTAEGIGECSTDPTHDIIIDLYALPSISLDDNMDNCQDPLNPQDIIISATVENQTLIRWTSNGTGNFGGLAFSNNEDPVYTPSAQDIDNGSVVLSVEVTGYAVCGAPHIINDNIRIDFTTPVGLQLNAPDTVCSSELINLTAITQPGDAAIEWDTDDGTPANLSSTSEKNSVYEPTAADIARGSVTFKLKSLANTVCPESSWITKTVTLTAVPQAIINTAAPLIVCEGTATVNIDASLVDASSYVWNFNNANGTIVYADPVDTTNPDLSYTPDPEDYGNTYVFTLTANPISPCADAVSTQVSVTFVPAPIVSAGDDIDICETGGYLAGTSISNISSFTWIGNGSFSPALNPSDPSTVRYVPSPAEINGGQAVVTLRGFPTNGCGNSVDDTRTLTINPLPSVDLNNTIDQCEDDGAYTFSNADFIALPQNYSTISWSHDGNGNLSNTTSIYPTYTPSALDTTVNITLTIDPSGSCDSNTSDSIVFNYITNPVINAGSDLSICATAGDNIPLNQGSSSSNNLSYQWESPTTGTFTDANALATNYQPSQADIDNGSVILSLKATSPAPCSKEVISTLSINFSEQPSLTINNNTEACFGSPITLTATGTFDNISWATNGQGVLNGNIYTPTDDESGLTLEFVATVSNNNNCASVNDNINITLIPEVTVDAGPTNLFICQSESQVNLQGIVNGSPDSVSWTLPVNSDSNITSNNTSATVLNIGPLDRANGSLDLAFSAIRGGTCPVNVTDQITLNFTESISVDAGNDVISCGQLPIDLSGVNVSSDVNVTYQWSSSGSGNFDNSSDLSTSYRPSLADISGTISLTITATKSINGCENVASDTIIVSFIQGTSIDAGGDLSVCEGTNIQPNGTVINADSYYWTSGGSGSFNGTETNEDPTYTPSAADITTGLVSITLVATSAGGCDGIISETILVTLYSTPSFEMDQDTDNDGEIFVCSSSDAINISASLNVSDTSVSNITWSTDGVGGIYTSGQGTLDVNYRFSANEKTAGSTRLRLNATGENGCSDPTEKVLLISFIDPIAGTPVKNADPGLACLGQGVTLSVNTIAEATVYNWTLPPGINLLAGAGSSSITVEIDALSSVGSKTIQVTAENDCGVTDPTSFEIYVSENTIEILNGQDGVCREDQGINYSVTSVPGASYSWNYSGTGATITAGDNTNSITVDYDNTSTSGSWTVTASLNCGLITNQIDYSVTVNEIPEIDSGVIQAQYCSSEPLGIVLSFNNKLTSEIASITWQRDQVVGIVPLTGEGNGININETLINNNNSQRTITYTINTIDNNGCENQETISFDLYAQLNITNNTSSVCSGDNIDLTFSNDNTASGINYSWSRVLSDGIISTSNAGFNGNTISETLINTTSNTIAVVYNVTQQVSGCTKTDTVTVTVNPLASYTGDVIFNMDSGQSTQLDLSSVTDIPASISWSVIPNANVTVENELDSSLIYLNQRLTNTTTTTQQIQYLVTMNTTNGNCVSTQTLTYIIAPCPVIDSSLDLVEICSGDNFNYTLSSNMGDDVTYSWGRDFVAGIQNTASTGSTKYINEDLINTSSVPVEVVYILNVNSNIGTCVTTEQIRVLVKPDPDVNSPLSISVCHGEVLEYEISADIPNTSFVWSQNQNIDVNSGNVANGNSNTISQLFENDSNIPQTVTYDITGTYDGCVGPTYQLQVVVTPEPIFIQSNDVNTPINVCSGQEFTQILSVNNDQNAAVNWTRNTTPGLQNEFASGTNAIVETLVNTTTESITVEYNVGIITSDGCSLPSSNTLYVTVSPTPVLTNAAANPTAICSGDDVNHTLVSNLPGTTFDWSRTLPDGVSSQSNPTNYQANDSAVINEVLVNNNNTTANVTYQVTLSRGAACGDQVVNITVPVYPSVSISSVNALSICSGEPTDYTITSNVPAQFSWQRLSNPNINGGAISNGNSASINEVLTNTSSATQDVYYEVISTDTLNGCVAATATVVVSVNPTPAIQSSLNEDICSGETFNYTITTNFDSGVGYSWSRPVVAGINGAARNGNGNTISEQLVNSTSDPIDVPYTVVVSYQGCTATSTVNLTVFPEPQLSSDLLVEVCSSQLFNYTPTSDTQNTAFQWTLGSLPAGVTHTGNTTGTNNIQGVFEHNYSNFVEISFSIISSANNCEGAAQNLTVRILPEVALTNLATATLCSGESVNFTPEFIPFYDNATFNWSRQLVPGISNTAGAGVGAITEVLENTTTISQTVTYQYSIQTNGGCTDQGSFSIIVEPKPVLTDTAANPTAICSGDDVNHTLV